MCVCSLTCDDGGGLTSHLVLVHILSIVQFSLHQNPGPERNSEGQAGDRSHDSHKHFERL